jgi:hypothetical protein
MFSFTMSCDGPLRKKRALNNHDSLVRWQDKGEPSLIPCTATKFSVEHHVKKNFEAQISHPMNITEQVK